MVKHFVCNDQEYERNSISAVVDERTLREIYLPPFEAAVKKAGVWAVMSAYNRLDGTYCSEHTALLTDLLRTEWGFDGLVVSDWRGTHSAGAVTAGLDLEMPGPPSSSATTSNQRSKAARSPRRRWTAPSAPSRRGSSAPRAARTALSRPALPATSRARRRPKPSYCCATTASCR